MKKLSFLLITYNLLILCQGVKYVFFLIKRISGKLNTVQKSIRIILILMFCTCSFNKCGMVLIKKSTVLFKVKGTFVLIKMYFICT